MSEKNPARSIRISGKSPIAQPPRAFQARSKSEHHPSDAASVKGTSESVATSVTTEDEHDEETANDRRVAELEMELNKMEEAFAEEFTRLSQKLGNESETAQFWQQKHSSLHQTFLKTDTDLRMLRAECAGREERDRDIKTKISSLMLDRDAFREAYNEAMGEVRGKEDLVRALQSQVWGLKSFVSSSSKMDEQVTDESFGERMQRLGNGLQNWVITGFRRAKIDIEGMNDETREQLLQLVPTYRSLASSSKIYLIQSLVSRLLVERIFSAYFIGLPKERADDLSKAEKYLSEFGSVESMNSWRSTTLAILKREAPNKLETEANAVTENIVAQVNGLMSSISDCQGSETRDQSLRSLILSSIELSRLLRVQKAVFSVLMPFIEDHKSTMFDPQSMEDIGGEDEDTLHEREIMCVAFPGIVKQGDENGERGYLRNVVAKIRVLCAPD